MTLEERTERQKAGTFYPFGTIPSENENYNFDDYVDHLVQNLGGPLRMFRGKMLDLVTMICSDQQQRGAARDTVFRGFEDCARLLEDWLDFYGLSDPEVRSWLKEE